MKKMNAPILFFFVLFAFNIASAQIAQNRKTTTPLFDTITRCKLRYFYFPNLEAYYDTKKSIYYFKENGQWKTAAEIPTGYRGYSIYNKTNVPITDYEDDEICQFVNIHKKQYPYSANGRVKRVASTN